MPNRLADETSPYLRQHQNNPVDWYPWSDEAFDTARDEDKPVLLSVGYSACHWCHVMAHESFENPDTAAVMNELFVNIKVDREERPDVDAIYMEAVQAMTGQGGWPMTVFLTPDGRPFYGGTYFPDQPRHGMPSFTDVLRAMDGHWQSNRDEVGEQADRLTEALGAVANLTPAPAVPGEALLANAYDTLRQQYDPRWGGFGGAPKFPGTMSLDLLLRAHHHNGSADTLAMVTNSLDAMASGGIYDHVGGAFARYSVDEEWLVPHFEKMLYDQALLTRVYLHAWQVTGEDRYRQVVDETIGYLLRDLRHPAGGFFSAEDADSEGVEGKFYVWSVDEIRDTAGDDADEAIAWWGVTASGNFEGANILHRPERGDLVRPPGVERARQRLFEVREKRIRPGLDDKVLTEWNALMVASLAEAAAATGDPTWLDAAVETGDFLLANLRRDDGRWLRSWQADGGARHLAYATDHAALVDAFTRLGEATGEARWLDEATTVAEALLDLFWDHDQGGVFTTGRDAESLVTRPKDLMDNATPSANSLAALALLRLSALTGDDTLRERAVDILRLLSDLAGKHPAAFGHLLAAVDLHTTGSTEIVVTGDRPDLVRAVTEQFLPNAVLAWGERHDSPLWEGRDGDQAYVCRQYACRRPVTDADALRAELARPTRIA
jgi:uncharacterized protein YyaL (SSP411 family)